MIVGLLGKAQSGKTTTAGIMLDQKGGEILSFATPLKQMIVNAGICSYHDIFIEKTWFSRKMMQLIGTNLFRDQVGKDFWINKMIEQVMNIRLENITTNIFIDDVRFPNEIEFIKKNKGTSIRIIRHSLESKDAHASETELDEVEVDHEIWNDGSIVQLQDIVADILTLVKGDW